MLTRPTKLSKKGAEFIASFEGFRGYAYNDPVGYATVGFGHLLHMSEVTPADEDRWGTRAHPKLTRKAALELLVKDAQSRANAVRRLVKVKLNQDQFDALVSLVFNIGEGNFAKSTLLRRLNAGDYRGVPVEMLKWNKAGRPPMPLLGLTHRRQAEGKLFKSKHAVTPKKVVVNPRNWWKRWVYGDTDCRRSLLVKLARLAKARNRKIFVRSGLRSRAEQEVLYAHYKRYGHPLAALPGTSNHEARPPDHEGHAADCQWDARNGPNLGDKVSRLTLSKYGLHLPVKGEPWHAEEL